MPPVIRRRALSPRGLQTTTTMAGGSPSRGRCARFMRVSILLGMIAGLVYFAVGFREAVDVASQKMQALRSSTTSAASSSFSTLTGKTSWGSSSSSKAGGIAGLTSREDVVELVRPKGDKKALEHEPAQLDNEVEDERSEENEEKQDDETEDEESRESEKLQMGAVSVDDENDVDDEEAEPAQPEQVVAQQNADTVIQHEEDDAPNVDAGKVVTEDAAGPSPENEVEEDLDNEEHAVDENAQDVIVEGTPGAEDDEEDDDSEEEELAAAKQGPQPMPRYKREELEERGFGHVLYAYRVVAPYVAIRTKPSPIGALALTSKDKMGLTKDSVKQGDIVVGYKLAKVHGLWLKIGPYTWAPVTKKETADGPFHPVMKQIRKISLPGNLRKYWRMRVVDCEATYKKADSKAACQDKNMVRNGVLNVMRRMKLIDSSMDPDVHPWPVPGLPSRRALHATSMTPLVPLPGVSGAASASEAQPVAVTDKIGSAATIQERATQPKTPLEKDASMATDNIAAAASSGDDDEQQALEEPTGDDANDEEEEDEVDTDVECKQFKFWHLCARHAKCAWRRLPNLEYCDLDTDPPIDEDNLPNELKQDSKYNFQESTKQRPLPKYFIYQPSGGWNNQRLLMESALIICKLLNRTCILPPAAPHSNYFNNYNNIPSSAIVGMPRVLNLEALNQVVPAVAVPRGVTFKSFMDDELFKSPRKYSIKTVFRDVTKYKPGTMKKWAEKDIVKMFSDETADILYFANQTLWGSIEWKGSLYGWPQRKQVQQAVMYPNHMKQVARKLAENLGPFHAVHIRRGDKVFETSFSRVYHDPEWYASRIVEFKNLAPKVYVATDEPNRSFFDAFKTHGLSMVFWESLPGYDNVLRPYLANFPKRMFMDVLGMVEQLLCSYAIMFLGSGYSTFTTYILRLRKYREIIAADTSFQDRTLGLPASIRNLKSTCDPIKALTHSKPC